MKKAPTDQMAEADKKASGDPKPFDIFAGLQGEPAQSNPTPTPSASAPFDVFAGMKSLDKNTAPPTQPKPETKPPKENRSTGIFLAVLFVVLVIGIIIGTTLSR